VAAHHWPRRAAARGARGAVAAGGSRPSTPDKAKTNSEIDGDHVNGVVEDEKVNLIVRALEEKGEEKEVEETDRRRYVGDGTREEKM